jgi:hypothetical protein
MIKLKKWFLPFSTEPITAPYPTQTPTDLNTHYIFLVVSCESETSPLALKDRARLRELW